MLTFEIVTDVTTTVPRELLVCFDRQGLESLLAQLAFIREGRTDHVHLMSNEWGDGSLADEPSHPGNAPIRHVKFQLEESS